MKSIIKPCLFNYDNISFDKIDIVIDGNGWIATFPNAVLWAQSYFSSEIDPKDCEDEYDRQGKVFDWMKSHASDVVDACINSKIEPIIRIEE